MNGYIITYSEESEKYFAEALYVKRCPSWGLDLYENDTAAISAAMKDGVKFIYGMNGVPDNIYIDTQENRQIIIKALSSKSLSAGEIQLVSYIDEKIKMLSEFKIQITEDEQRRLQQQEGETAVDRFVRTIFDKYL